MTAAAKKAAPPPLKQKAQVRTNTTKDSVCRIDVPAVKFADLWANYVTGDPYRDPKTGKVPPGFGNQCAIRMSATLHQVGIEMKSFTQANVTLAPGEQFGRILLDGKYAAVRANQMGSWLSKQPFCGLPPKPENISGQEWESKVKGRTGIIMFDGYWARDGESASSASGGHIDLWNGSRLTMSSFGEGLATIGRYIGIQSFRQGARVASTFSYSDLRNSKTILFWEVK
ncbi:type VI secretion system amidase effector protein Tae4 [Ralstonia pseudosolanacearum]|uniref:type VI secretion system amidase effector protein Tae4 n=1 Tax=Ralstonia pseudosolanacearum TaxID=1310165 RepID=UPI00267605D4|nr:type VI secretion system amidase effector protein Tae4 [Ralstonia pseudosolanacearum]MDO3620220.1 type VI secretion system amidase effector protein Tae4 [Ralstonia pseudosolanacearum]